ncbi:hypothetical protein J6590_013133 [Homalodisca vitripennis]|nr:hypothetical protein J6590_013133 [Homalodisca vitripennis]
MTVPLIALWAPLTRSTRLRAAPPARRLKKPNNVFHLTFSTYGQVVPHLSGLLHKGCVARLTSPLPVAVLATLFHIILIATSELLAIHPTISQDSRPSAEPE